MSLSQQTLMNRSRHCSRQTRQQTFTQLHCQSPRTHRLSSSLRLSGAARQTRIPVSRGLTWSLQTRPSTGGRNGRPGLKRRKRRGAGSAEKYAHLHCVAQAAIPLCRAHSPGSLECFAGCCSGRASHETVPIRALESCGAPSVIKCLLCRGGQARRQGLCRGFALSCVTPARKSSRLAGCRCRLSSHH